MLNLIANDKIENQPVIIRQISKKVSQSGKEYFHLQISFGIKNYDAKIWNGSETILKEITPGCFAYIWGNARDFKGSIQIHIDQIEKILEPDKKLIEMVTPTSDIENTKLIDNINEIIESVDTPELKSLLNIIFNLDSIKNSFYKKAAGAEIHHAFTGGLAQHTIEVTKTVIYYCNLYNCINYDVAVAASLLHDIGKTVELSNFPENKYTTRGRMIGHISLGIEILNNGISEIENFPNSLKTSLEHCILSHHGTLEMGSPILPMTLEAIALCNADRASAEINGFYLAIQRDSGTDEWTDYNNIYKRYIKK